MPRWIYDADVLAFIDYQWNEQFFRSYRLNHFAKWVPPLVPAYRAALAVPAGGVFCSLKAESIVELLIAETAVVRRRPLSRPESDDLASDFCVLDARISPGVAEGFASQRLSGAVIRRKRHCILQHRRW